MALSPQVVHLILELFKSNPDSIKRVACLGYPDILLPLDHLEKDFGLNGLEPLDDSHKVTKFHGRGSFVVPTAESFFKALGVENLIILDIKQWRGNEVVADLNEPFSSQPGLDFKVDLLIDNGTTEHCFNAPEAMKNYLSIIRDNGFILHWNPHHMPNHGFYNFSPTFFFDWYQHHGCEVVRSELWNFESSEGQTSEVGYGCPSQTSRFNFPSYNNSLLTLVHCGNISKSKEKASWPTQTKYRKMGINNDDSTKSQGN